VATSGVVSVSIATSLADKSLLAKIRGGFTVADTAAHLEALTGSQISALKQAGATTLFATDANVAFAPGQTAAILAAGLKVSAAGSHTVTEYTSNGFNVYENGTLTLSKYVKPDGTYEIYHGGITGQTYTDYETVYTASNQKVAAVFDNVDGSGMVRLFEPNLAVNVTSNNETLTFGSTTGRLPHHVNETIEANWQKDEAFRFSAGFGHDDISGFVAKGSGHDTVTLSKSMFSYLTSTMTQAQDISAVLNHATASGGNLAIVDTLAGHDALTIDGMTKAQILTNPADFKFV
jgi:hypothetical protein